MVTETYTEVHVMAGILQSGRSICMEIDTPAATLRDPRPPTT
jgi:hypothetical protein